MSILRVARMGHPVLRMQAHAVPANLISSEPVQRLIDDMLETVDAYDGAGLAAPQVHQSVRIVVLDLADDDGLRVWINPVVRALTTNQRSSMEGCLSIPDLRASVSRPTAISVQATDRHGQPVSLELQGFPAVVAQHECDHLDGILYVDRTEPRSLAFLDEYHRFGAWPYLDDLDEDDLDEDDLDEDDLDEDELSHATEDD